MTARSTYRIPFPYYEVLWEDATANNDSWIHKDEEVTTALIYTRGWLVNDKPAFISIASSVSGDGDGEDMVGNVATIPRGMIKNMREVRVVAPRKKKVKVP